MWGKASAIPTRRSFLQRIEHATIEPTAGLLPDCYEFRTSASLAELFSRHEPHGCASGAPVSSGKIKAAAP
jgi:hypothetical protein